MSLPCADGLIYGADVGQNIDPAAVVERRERAGLSQRDAVALFGVSRGTWQKMEATGQLPRDRRAAEAIQDFVLGSTEAVKTPEGWRLRSTVPPPFPLPALTPAEHAALLAKLEAAHGLYREARLEERPDGSVLIEVTFPDGRRYREERAVTGRAVVIERPAADAESFRKARSVDGAPSERIDKPAVDLPLPASGPYGTNVNVTIATQRKGHDTRPIEGGSTIIRPTVSKSEKKKLKRWAAAKGCSLSEIVRALVAELPDEPPAEDGAPTN